MAWTAKIDRVVKDRGNVRAMVVFTEGQTQETFREEYLADNLDMGKVQKLATLRVRSLRARDMSFSSLAPGPVVLLADDVVI